MSNQPFEFKEFVINQDKCAMKIGTDSVLLGAWTDLTQNPDSILDIGTGSGILALQLAQRSDAEVIDAIEIEPNAYEQAFENFENSPWGDRLFCYHISLQEFTSEIDEKYELIISNPPFYNDTFKELKNDRATARHTINLTFEDLLKNVSLLLTENGVFSVILPFQEEENFINIAHLNNLYPKRLTRVKGNENTPFKRSLIDFTFQQNEFNLSELTIEIERHVYTNDYKDLVKDFYLKM